MLRDKVSSATEEELSAINEYINTYYEEKKDRHERPWTALKVDDVQSEADLEKEYMTQ